MKMKLFILIAAAWLSSGKIFAAQDVPINFTYPSFTGDFYVSGNVSFPPGAVKSERNVIIKHKSGRKLPARITVLRRWPDNSVLSAGIVFAANASKKHDYVLSYGQEIRGEKAFQETAVLPAVLFSVAGSPKISERIDIDVGGINVRVDKSPGVYYYWHIIPIVLLVALAYYRCRRTKKTS